jgi:cell division protein FtsW (lipid II flippase)
MDERIRIILIILISVSIFGLLVFVFLKNYMRQRLKYFLNKKNNKKKSQ